MRIKPPKAGWRVGEYAEAIGIARSTLYELPAPMQPASVKFGGVRIITEDPRKYLQRIAAAQAGDKGGQP
jgi:hypothetical protein